ncbi:MAG TPA: hypothetical protein VJA65_06985, partial [bacterium]|nr:hypothetical protein [bacterium]
MRRRLRKVAVTLILIPVFLAVALIPQLPPPAYAASPAPPGEMPEDPLAQQPEKQEPEISINVDVRDGHVTVRVVDIWGPGRRPLVVRSLTNATSKSATAVGSWQFNLLMDVVPNNANDPTKWFVREPDGNRGTYKDPVGTRFTKSVGSYATMDVTANCNGSECTGN